MTVRRPTPEPDAPIVYSSGSHIGSLRHLSKLAKLANIVTMAKWVAAGIIIGAVMSGIAGLVVINILGQ